MNWTGILESWNQTILETDFSLLARPDVLLAILGVYLAVVWKRGVLKAFFFVLLSTLSLTVTYAKMEACAGSLLYAYYFAAFLCLGALLVLYIVYLYALKEQIDSDC